ncbi:hypothetical protein OROMI_002731 [Orobanche minor]
MTAVNCSGSAGATEVLRAQVQHELSARQRFLPCSADLISPCSDKPPAVIHSRHAAQLRLCSVTRSVSGSVIATI